MTIDLELRDLRITQTLQILKKDSKHVYMFQNVFDFTRAREKCAPSRLDYIFTSEENLVENLFYGASIGKSDHVCLTWDFVHAMAQFDSDKCKRLNFWKGDYKLINQELMAVNWESELKAVTIEENWTIFKEKLSKQIRKHIPLKITRKKVYSHHG